MNIPKETVKLFWQHATKYPQYLIPMFFAFPISVILMTFVQPYITSIILEKISSGNFDANNLWASFGSEILLFGVIALYNGALGWRITIWLLWKLELRVTRDMARRIFNHLMKMSANFHNNRFAGSLTSQANKIVSAYIRFTDSTFFSLYWLILVILFTIIILAPRVPIYAVVLVVLSTLYIFVTIKLYKKVRKFNTLEAQAESKQTGALADSISNVMAVKSFSTGEYELERYSDVVNQTFEAGTNSMRISLQRDMIAGGITSSISVAALALAVISVGMFNIDVATVFLMITYTASIVQRLWEFQRVMRSYSKAFGDATDMVKILKIEPGVKDPENPEKTRMKKGKVEFKDVSFTHPDAGDALFRNLNIEIKPGEKIGLVGHSGSGKTTFTKLLLRFSDIDSGEILIDGQNIIAVTQDDLRSVMAYVPQEPLLFHRTIHENIAYGKPGATDKEIREAAKKASAAEFIEGLPHSYGTLVGERGVKLSGGQRQRIVIARAILKDAPILVLDEATSALDSESEKLIQSALWKLMEGRTAIVIAHRLSTIQKMDRILVLEDGKIVEQGTHKSLVKKNGEYAKLWAHQSGDFLDE